MVSLLWSVTFLIEATVCNNTADVRLQGTFMKGRQPDLPTMIWLPEITEPAQNFQKFFGERQNKVLDVRNVWLLDYRNQGESDFHPSYNSNTNNNDNYDENYIGRHSTV